MGETGLKSRPSLRTWPMPSLRPWPGPSFWAQMWLGEIRAVTPAMGATEVLSQTNVAKLESSYQALPSSSIALQFLHGLEGISATPWPWPMSTFQDEGWLVDSRRGKTIWIRPRREDQWIWLDPGFGEATRGPIRAG
ncbi:unnamed protein product [Prunus armeniaca]